MIHKIIIFSFTILIVFSILISAQSYESTNVALNFETVNKAQYVFGSYGYTLYRSSDGMQTAVDIFWFDNIIAGIYAMSNGMLFVSTDDGTWDIKADCHIYRSTDNGETFKLVKTIIGGTVLNWSFTSDKENNLYIGEYGPKTLDSSKTVWKSVDYGNTWKVVFSAPIEDNVHIHVVAVDPYTDYVWVVHGDTGHSGTWVSEDHGSTWKTVRVNAQPTSVVFTKDFIYWGEDGEKGIITKYDKKTEEFQTVLNASECGNYGGSVYAMVIGKSGLIYASMVKYNTQSHIPAIWVGDGTNWKVLLPIEAALNENAGYTTISNQSIDDYLYIRGFRIKDPIQLYNVVESDMNWNYLQLSNYPNPFNSSTVIKFVLPDSGYCILKVYNYVGQIVNMLLEGWMDKGIHTVIWNGENSNGINCANGIYYSYLIIKTQIISQKMLLLR